MNILNGRGCERRGIHMLPSVGSTIITPAKLFLCLPAHVGRIWDGYYPAHLIIIKLYFLFCFSQ